MRNILKAGLVAAAMVVSGIAYSSHHFEGVAFLSDTRLAQVDNFIFPASRPGHTGIVMIVNYDPKAGDDKTFSPDGVYNMHLASDLGLKAGKTFSFRFDKDRYDVFVQDNPNPAPGVVGEKIGSGVIGKAGSLNGEIKSFADVVRDPFFGNAIALEAFRAQNLQGKYDEGIWKAVNGESAFAERKVGALVLEVPNALLGDKVFAYFSTSAKSGEGYRQVQYSAIPLMSHLMMFDDNVLRKTHDESRPTQEYSAAMRQLVSARITRATVLSGSDKNPVRHGDETAARILPDVIPYEIGTPTAFTVDRINGRGFDEDVMSVMLTWLLGKPTDQAMANTRHHTADFPYVMPTKP